MKVQTKEFVTLVLGDKPFTFRALDLDQIEELENQFAVVTAVDPNSIGLPKDALQAVAQIAAASMKAKHPDLDVPAVRKLITLGTMQAVIEAVRGVSQLQEAGPSGEPEAGSR
jgi:hypothetical protein